MFSQKLDEAREFLTFLNDWIFYLGGVIACVFVWALAVFVASLLGYGLVLKLLGLLKVYGRELGTRIEEVVLACIARLLGVQGETKSAPKKGAGLKSSEIRTLIVRTTSVPEPSDVLIAKLLELGRPTLAAFRLDAQGVPIYDAYFIHEGERILSLPESKDLWCNVAFLSPGEHQSWRPPANTLLVIIDVENGSLEISDKSSSNLPEAYQRMLLEGVCERIESIEGAIGRA